MEHLIFLIPFFFLTALIYSSVGFAGGSTYLALLALFAFPYELMPKVSLICNLVVAGGGLYHYIRGNTLPFRRVLPFVITSIPFAYLGGITPISKQLFLTLLALSLAVAGLRLLFSETIKVDQANLNSSTRRFWMVGLPLGSLLGFLSGLVGIGGGIFLAPILYFLRWGNARQIAAMASFFIFVNSLSGFFGQITKTGSSPFVELVPSILPLIIAVFMGGQIGSRLSVGGAAVPGGTKLPLGALQRVTAVLILYVSGNIFWKLLPIGP